METSPEDPFDTVKARIVGGDERQVVGVSRGVGGVRVMETINPDLLTKPPSVTFRKPPNLRLPHSIPPDPFPGMLVC